MPDTLEDKAARILADGRLTIERLDPGYRKWAGEAPSGEQSHIVQGWVVARCQGITGEYRLGFDPITRGYRCSCPHLPSEPSPFCSHVYALKLVVEDWQEV